MIIKNIDEMNKRFNQKIQTSLELRRLYLELGNMERQYFINKFIKLCKFRQLYLKDKEELKELTTYLFLKL